MHSAHSEEINFIDSFSEPVRTLADPHHPLAQLEIPRQANIFKYAKKNFQKYKLEFTKKDIPDLIRLLFEVVDVNIDTALLCIGALQKLDIDQYYLYNLLFLFDQKIMGNDDYWIEETIEQLFISYGERGLYVAETTLFDRLNDVEQQKIYAAELLNEYNTFPVLETSMVAVIVGVAKRNSKLRDRCLYSLSRALTESMSASLNADIILHFSEMGIKDGYILGTIRKAFIEGRVNVCMCGDYVSYCEETGIELDPFDFLVKERQLGAYFLKDETQEQIDKQFEKWRNEHKIKLKELRKKKKKEMREKALENAKQAQNSKNKSMFPNIADHVEPQIIELENLKRKKRSTSQQIVYLPKEVNNETQAKEEDAATQFLWLIFTISTDLKINVPKLSRGKSSQIIRAINYSNVDVYLKKIRKYYINGKEATMEPLQRETIKFAIELLRNPYFDDKLVLLDLLGVCAIHQKNIEMMVDENIGFDIIHFLKLEKKEFDTISTILLGQIVRKLRRNDSTRILYLIENNNILPHVYRLLKTEQLDVQSNCFNALYNMASITDAPVAMIRKGILQYILEEFSSNRIENQRLVPLFLLNLSKKGQTIGGSMYTSSIACIQTMVHYGCVDKLIGSLQDKDYQICYESARCLGQFTREETCRAYILKNNLLPSLIHCLQEVDKKNQVEMISEMFIIMAHMAWDEECRIMLRTTTPFIGEFVMKWATSLIKNLKKNSTLSDREIRLLGRCTLFISGIVSDRILLEKMIELGVYDFLVDCLSIAKFVDTLHGTMGAFHNIFQCKEDLIKDKTKFVNALARLYMTGHQIPHFNQETVLNLIIILHRYSEETKQLLYKAAEGNTSLTKLLSNIAKSEKRCKFCQKLEDLSIGRDLKVCARCKKVFYCSKECQKSVRYSAERKTYDPSEEEPYDEYTEVELNSPEIREALKKHFNLDDFMPSMHDFMKLQKERKDILIRSNRNDEFTVLTYLIPILELVKWFHLTEKDLKQPGFRVLIITPNRDAARNVYAVIDKYLKDFRIKAAVVYGGQRIYDEMHTLDNIWNYPEIVVGTAGRLNFHLQNSDYFNNLKWLIISGGDYLIATNQDMIKQVDKIIEQLPKNDERQTCIITNNNEFKISEEHIEKGYISSNFEELNYLDETPYQHAQQKIMVIDNSSIALAATLFNILKENRHKKIMVFLPTRFYVDFFQKIFAQCELYTHALHSHTAPIARHAIRKYFSKRKNGIILGTRTVVTGWADRSFDIVINVDTPITNRVEYRERLMMVSQNKDAQMINIITSDEEESLMKNFGDLGRPFERTEAPQQPDPEFNPEKLKELQTKDRHMNRIVNDMIVSHVIYTTRVEDLQGKETPPSEKFDRAVKFISEFGFQPTQWTEREARRPFMKQIHDEIEKRGLVHHPTPVYAKPLPTYEQK